MTALAPYYARDAQRPLVLSMNEGERGQARIAAAMELLDRGLGKLRQRVELARDKKSDYYCESEQRSQGAPG